MYNPDIGYRSSLTTPKSNQQVIIVSLISATERPVTIVEDGGLGNHKVVDARVKPGHDGKGSHCFQHDKKNIAKNPILVYITHHDWTQAGNGLDDDR
ncbi:MAG: hypothetical protein HY059_19245 [Proteobacteria bacterium]|nr:hypothetical protein [Pseudomonadota bacterium]